MLACSVYEEACGTAATVKGNSAIVARNLRRWACTFRTDCPATASSAQSWLAHGTTFARGACRLLDPSPTCMSAHHKQCWRHLLAAVQDAPRCGLIAAFLVPSTICDSVMLQHVASSHHTYNDLGHHACRSTKQQCRESHNRCSGHSSITIPSRSCVAGGQNTTT